LTLHSIERADSPLALLPILCCEAAGGERSQATPIAAAWLLLYMAAKMLDDVEDDELDTSQTMSPAQAINVATGLIFASQPSLALLRKQGVDSDLLFSLHEDFNRTALRVCAGQHADLLEEVPSLEHCFRVIATKSGEPFALACRAGASLGTDDQRQIALYSEFGYNLGVLIQIDNDFNGAWNPKGRSDLAAGKRTLPVIYALSVAPMDLRGQLKGLLSKAISEPQAEEEARRIITELGALQYMMVEAQIRRQRAESALHYAGSSSPAYSKLINLLDEHFKMSDDAIEIPLQDAIEDKNLALLGSSPPLLDHLSPADGSFPIRLDSTLRWPGRLSHHFRG